LYNFKTANLNSDDDCVPFGVSSQNGREESVSSVMEKKQDTQWQLVTIRETVSAIYLRASWLASPLITPGTYARGMTA